MSSRTWTLCFKVFIWDNTKTSSSPCGHPYTSSKMCQRRPFNLSRNKYFFSASRSQSILPPSFYRKLNCLANLNSLTCYLNNVAEHVTYYFNNVENLEVYHLNNVENLGLELEQCGKTCDILLEQSGKCRDLELEQRGKICDILLE